MTEALADGRFKLLRSIGEGGFGAVYEAEDIERGERVAVKRLRRLDSSALLDFKNEFRSLAEILHPNLVKLHELFFDGSDLFFTMELIDGQDLVSFARNESQTQYRLSFDEPRVRSAFAQLGEAMSALHGRGLLHRDLKPANVLVDRHGTVKVLDFGLVAHLGAKSSGGLDAGSGTPAYMSPEQSARTGVGPASDCYAIGVMLYEALTGRLPFEGTIYQIIAARETGELRAVRELVANVPPDLDDLCSALLQRDPAVRLSAAEVCSRLGRESVELRGRPSEISRMVGRAAELAELRAAWSEALDGRSGIAFITGESGFGKSTLARSFQESVAESDNALVLSGRCYPRESVPYKALDGVMDALRSELVAMPANKVGELVPPDAAAMARLFPVFRDLARDSAGADILDAQELRRRGFAAIRELLIRITKDSPVVIHIDDLQWGDVDSGNLIMEILRGPDAPRVLVVACYTGDEGTHSPLLRFLSEHLPKDLVRCEITLGPLPSDDLIALALARLGESNAATRGRAESLARESNGNPFFIDELLRHQRLVGDEDTEMVRLDNVIEGRLSRLPADARQLLEVIAVAGGPVDARAANQAAGLDPRDRTMIDLLTAEQWIRRRADHEREVFESYHDRLRQTVVSRIAEPRLPTYHNRLASALDVSGIADAETLAEHYLIAGDRDLAARHTLRAAEQAAASLAFERAARLYRAALELRDASPAESLELRIRLADALANASQGVQAAQEYLLAARSAMGDQLIELTRRAGEQYLISGAIDEGLGVLRSVLAIVNMRLSKTPKHALLNLLRRRIQLRLRGLGFEPHRAAEVDAQLLREVDVCWSVAMGLSMVDTIESAHFQTVGLIRSLQAGEPFRVARGLTLEYGMASITGPRSQPRAQMLQRACADLVSQVDHPYTTGWFLIMRGIAANFAGEFPASLQLCEEGEAALRAKCTGVAWEVETAQLYQLHSLAWMNRWPELAQRAYRLLEEARRRNDRYLTTYIRTRILFLLHLAADDAAAARREQDASLDQWSQQGFQIQHYWNWMAQCSIDLYEQKPEAAWARLEKDWQNYRATFLPRTRAVHAEIIFVKARAALALMANANPTERKRLYKEVARIADELECEKSAWTVGRAELLRGALAILDNDHQSASALLLQAERHFDTGSMRLHSAAARWTRGALMKGEPGRELQQQAAAQIEERGGRNVERLIHEIIPVP